MEGGNCKHHGHNTYTFVLMMMTNLQKLLQRSVQMLRAQVSQIQHRRRTSSAMKMMVYNSQEKIGHAQVTFSAQEF